MIELKPIRESTSEYDEIERRIRTLLKKLIYIPILKELNVSSSRLTNSAFSNSKNDLLDAIRLGKITYNKGIFSGKLTSTLTKELKALGAKWNKVQKAFSLPSKYLPLDVRSVIAASESKFVDKIKSIDKKLASVVPEDVASKLQIEKIFDRTIYKVETEFQKSVRNLTIAPQLTPEMRARIAKEWQKNLQLYVSDFTKQEIIKLRTQIAQSVEAGNRYEDAIKTIQKSFNVTRNKAKFLARQETALMMAKLKEVRYQDAGVNEYKWKSVSGTPQHPVRPRHKQLNDESAKGKIFRFDDPPVTSEPGQPQRKNNPGQDYNCRCIAIPVVRFKKS